MNDDHAPGYLIHARTSPQPVADGAYEIFIGAIDEKVGSFRFVNTETTDWVAAELMPGQSITFVGWTFTVDSFDETGAIVAVVSPDGDTFPAQ